MGSCAALAALGLAVPRLPISALRNLNLSLLIIPSSASSSSSSTLRTKANPRRLFCAPSSPSISLPLQIEGTSKEEEEEEEEEQQQQQQQQQVVERVEEVTQQQLPRLPSPKLSLKERKELASYAHSLGKKLKSQQVGKSGVTPSVAASFVENLESNELLKLKIHGSCPGELIDVIKELEAATGSIAVDQIGRSVILYRPSQSKMNKREAAALRKSKEHSAFKVQKKAQASRVTGEGRYQL